MSEPFSVFHDFRSSNVRAAKMEHFMHPEGFRVMQHDAWVDFKQNVQNYKNCLFRGHRSPAWRLQSPWDRCMVDIGLGNGQDAKSCFLPGMYNQNRDQYVAYFREIVSSFEPDAAEFNEDILWLLGRHHGLKSPFLDWTMSPLIAAFFAYSGWAEWILDSAICDKEDRHRRDSTLYVSVWVLNSDAESALLPDMRIIRSGPLEFEKRRKAQQGSFTRLLGDRYFDVLEYLSSRGMVDFLIRHDLPVRSTGDALCDLHRIGIHYGALFPDFEGAARYANWHSFFYAKIQTAIVR